MLQASKSYGYCVVQGCKGRQPGDDIVMCGFPSDRELLKKWLANLRLPEDVQPTSYMRVCSTHFEVAAMGVRRITRGSLPTLNLGYKEKPPFENKTRARIKCIRDCIVPSCTPDPNARLLKFPPDAERRRRWLIACNISFPNQFMLLQICEKHFERRYLGDSGRIALNAVPTLHLKSPTNDKKETWKKPIKRVLRVKTPEEPPDELEPEFISEDEAPVEKKPATATSDVVPNDVEKRTYFVMHQIKQEMSAKIYKLENEVAELRKRNKELELESTGLRSQVEHMKKHEIQSHRDASEHAKLFAKMIVGSPMQWYTSQERTLAENIYYMSPKTYEMMRDGLNFRLPQKKTLSRWCPIKLIRSKRTKQNTEKMEALEEVYLEDENSEDSDQYTEEKEGVFIAESFQPPEENENEVDMKVEPLEFNYLPEDKKKEDGNTTETSLSAYFTYDEGSSC